MIQQEFELLPQEFRPTPVGVNAIGNATEYVWPDAAIEKFRELWDEGRTRWQMVQHFGVGRSVVDRMHDELGLTGQQKKRRVITARQASLGLGVSRTSIQRWIALGYLPAIRIRGGGTDGYIHSIKRDDLQAFLTDPQHFKRIRYDKLVDEEWKAIATEAREKYEREHGPMPQLWGRDHLGTPCDNGEGSTDRPGADTGRNDNPDATGHLRSAALPDSGSGGTGGVEGAEARAALPDVQPRRQLAKSRRTLVVAPETPEQATEISLTVAEAIAKAYRASAPKPVRTNYGLMVVWQGHDPDLPDPVVVQWMPDAAVITVNIGLKRGLAVRRNVQGQFRVMSWGVKSQPLARGIRVATERLLKWA